MAVELFRPDVSVAESGTPVRLNLLVTGLYAWVATVAAPTWGARAPWTTQLAAAGALVALVGGLLVAERARRIGYAVTMGGFLGLSSVTWVLLGPALDAERIEPVRAALGGVGWVLFAFGWGVVRKPDAVPENDPHVIVSQPLAARGALPRGTYWVMGVALLGAAMPWFAAWRAVGKEHSLFAQAMAWACAVAMVATGAQVAVLRGQRRIRPRAAERLNVASPGLAGLVVLGILGVVLWAVRG